MSTEPTTEAGKALLDEMRERHIRLLGHAEDTRIADREDWLDIIGDDGRRIVEERLPAIENEAREQGAREERERLREAIVTYVMIAILALRNGGGVTANEAKAIGEKVARLVFKEPER